MKKKGLKRTLAVGISMMLALSPLSAFADFGWENWHGGYEAGSMGLDPNATITPTPSPTPTPGLVEWIVPEHVEKPQHHEPEQAAQTMTPPPAQTETAELRTAEPVSEEPSETEKPLIEAIHVQNEPVGEDAAEFEAQSEETQIPDDVPAMFKADEENGDPAQQPEQETTGANVSEEEVQEEGAVEDPNEEKDPAEENAQQPEEQQPVEEVTAEDVSSEEEAALPEEEAVAEEITGEEVFGEEKVPYGTTYTFHLTYIVDAQTRTKDYAVVIGETKLPFALTAPEKISGKTFFGCYTDAAYTERVVSITEEDILNGRWQESNTLYGFYERTKEEFDIRYHVDGKIVKTAKVRAEKFAPGYTLWEGKAPAGYTMDGWYLSDAMAGSAVTVLTVPEDYDLYAEYRANVHQIRYDGNAIDAVNVPADESAAYGEKVYVSLEKPTSASSGEFIGWAISGVVCPVGATSFVMPDNDVTLTAQWKNTSYYTITYLNSDGTFVDQIDNVEFGSVVPQHSKPGRPADLRDAHFMCWEYKNAAGRYVPLDASAIVTDNMVVRAVWGYEVTYKDGTKYHDVFGTRKKMVPAGSWTPDLVDDDELERKYYRFVGWRADNASGIGQYNRVNRDVVYTAVWRSKNGSDVPKTGDAGDGALLGAGFACLVLAMGCEIIRRRRM